MKELTSEGAGQRRVRQVGGGRGRWMIKHFMKMGKELFFSRSHSFWSQLQGLDTGFFFFFERYTTNFFAIAANSSSEIVVLKSHNRLDLFSSP